MHDEILDLNQTHILPIIKEFSDVFGLVGGTAIALHLGHRKSVDFDLFSIDKINTQHISNKLSRYSKIEHLFFKSEDELTVLVNNVKLTFLYFPYKISFTDDFENFIKLPNLKTLAAMKAFALSKRSKWKDYVDLYFILHIFSITDIVEITKSIFESQFNEKFFRVQLSYFADVDFSESVHFIDEHYVSENEVKTFLTDISLK